MFDTALRICTDEAGEGLHDELADLRFTLRHRALNKARVEYRNCDYVNVEYLYLRSHGHLRKFVI